MGLKESGLRGSLRNVSVGIDAIPDSGLLHDDWSDSPSVTSDGLADRSTWNELEFQGENPEEDPDYDPQDSRPDWEGKEGDDWEVDDGLLFGDSRDNVLGTDEVFSEQELTYAFDFEFLDTTGTGDAGFGIYGDDDDSYTGVGFWGDTILIRINDTEDEGFTLEHRDDGGSGTTIIDSTWDGNTEKHSARLDVWLEDDDQHFELYLNGNSVGTGTNDSASPPGWMYFYNDTDAPVRFSNFRVISIDGTL